MTEIPISSSDQDHPDGDAGEDIPTKKKIEIHALGANVIVQKYEAGDKVGRIFVPSGYMDRPWGKVLSVGPGLAMQRIHDGDTCGTEYRPICGGVVKVGSLVIYTQGHKIEIPEAGGTLWVVAETDLISIVEGA